MVFSILGVNKIGGIMMSFVGCGYFLGNVRVLSIDCDWNVIWSFVKIFGRWVVIDVKNVGVGDVGDVDIGFGGDFVIYYYLFGCYDGFYGSVRMGVFG